MVLNRMGYRVVTSKPSANETPCDGAGRKRLDPHPPHFRLFNFSFFISN